MSSQTTLEACAEPKLPVNERTDQVQRAQWLRAAILGATDGLISTTSIMLGVGADKESRRSMVLSGIAGALAGACSMAVGEFVSVSTQRDIEKATLISHSCSTIVVKDDVPTIVVETPTTMVIPKPKLLAMDCSPGRSPIMKVINTKDAGTNTIEEAPPAMYNNNGSGEALPSPSKAAAASALAFLCGSLVPLAAAMFAAENTVGTVVIVAVTSIALALFGGMGAHLGGSPIRASAVRVQVGGWIAMAFTFGSLKPFDKDHKGSNDTD